MYIYIFVLNQILHSMGSSFLGNSKPTLRCKSFMQSFFCFTSKQRKSNKFAIIYYEILYAMKMHLEVIYKLQRINMGWGYV